jgi:hypothetical protein
MSEKELREKIAQEILEFKVPEAPTGAYANPMFDAMYNAQVTIQTRLAELVRG